MAIFETKPTQCRSNASIWTGVIIVVLAGACLRLSAQAETWDSHSGKFQLAQGGSMLPPDVPSGPPPPGVTTEPPVTIPGPPGPPTSLPESPVLGPGVALPPPPPPPPPQPFVFEPPGEQGVRPLSPSR